MLWLWDLLWAAGGVGLGADGPGQGAGQLAKWARAWLHRPGRDGGTRVCWGGAGVEEHVT